MSATLERLNLQGYKSFANSTEFLFEGAITAIVGPNGSGKSNVADAIRWALGEQSYGTLRGRRTEDMIFSGSDGHRPLGMAHAELQLANQDEWLPVDFGKVTVGRRAYRSGENEYLLNQTQVRLRDIADLLAEGSVGAYSVIGQGLVDRVLSLSSQERRHLFEEASGTVGYRARRFEAIRRLGETEINLTRIHDITEEIAPRLVRLKRQAEETEKRASLNSELEGALLTWYGYQWRRRQEQLQQARRRAERHAAILLEAREQLQGIQRDLGSLGNASLEAEAQFSAVWEERQALRQRLADLTRTKAVREERERLLSQRQDEDAEEILELRAQSSQQAIRNAEHERAMAQLETKCLDQEAEVERLRVLTVDLERECSSLRAHIGDLRRDLADVSRAHAEGRGERSLLRQHRDRLLAEQRTHGAAISEGREQSDNLEQERSASARREKRLDSQLAALEAQLRSHVESGRTLETCKQDLENIGQQLVRDMEYLAERRAILSHTRSQAYGPGVEAVLRAAREGTLVGIRGPVAEMLAVPREWEELVQIALGDRLGSVVVKDWAAAVGAMSFLAESRAGRAAFLPEESLDPPSPTKAVSMDGVLGWATDLIPWASGELPDLAAHLLSGTLVARDLEVAGAAVASLGRGQQVLTLKGELLCFDGFMTGGSESEAGLDTLSLEREWRELPGRVEDLQVQIEEVVERKKAAADELEALQEAMDLLRSQIEDSRGLLAHQSGETARLTVAHEQTMRSLTWHQERAARNQEDLSAVEAREACLEESLSGLDSQESELHRKLECREARLGSLEERVPRGELESVRTALAVGKEALRRERERLREAVARQEGMVVRTRHLVEKQAMTADLLSALQHEIYRLTQREDECENTLQQIAEREKEIEENVRNTRASEQSLARTERDLRHRLREYESRANEISLAVVRGEDGLHRLRDRVLGDLRFAPGDLDDIVRLQDLPTQTAFDMETGATALPRVTVLPPGLKDQIDTLRRRLGRLGSVNPDAPAEYLELKERHEFLVEQSSDLKIAADSLRQVVAELDQVTEQRFYRTFEAVAERFAEHFTFLFGGGQGHLVLTEPGDLAHTGVDVRVQPPGKREQGLAVLSGGERALAAVALIFAFLSVSGTPFCLLDEVDATLDEANSERFRDLLGILARDTQFVVITHNRRTVEAAGTVYGVSMDERGVSQAISLRLDQVAAAVSP